MKKTLALGLAAITAGMCLSACSGGKVDDPAKDTTKKNNTNKKDYATINKEETGLKAYYNMKRNEAGNVLLDQSGNGNDATLFMASNIEMIEEGVMFLKDGAYAKLPDGMFEGEETISVSIWLKNYSGSVNTSAMYIGSKQKTPTSYWLFNPCNPACRMKSVITNKIDASAPYNTEAGITPTISGNGIQGPFTAMEWGHYVTIISKDKLTAYYNGEKVGSVDIDRNISDFGDTLVAFIGKSSYADPTFTGFVKEVKIYDTVISEQDIKSLYEEGKTEVEKTGTKTDIFIADRADPYITLGKDGYYYFTASYPMYGGADKEGYDRVILRRAKTIEGLKDAEEKVIWDEKDSDICNRFIWAPEMHYIGGKWYVYYAASSSPNNVWDINCHVIMCEGDDPYNDPWVEKGKFQAAEGDTFSFTGFSLDMTYFECNNRSYVIWAQNGGNSNLYMAEVDPAEPWKTITPNMLLTKPEYYWEKVVIPVNEGASVVIHDDKVIVAYSASATGPEYCIGLMYADVNSDLLDIKSWTKMDKPALTSEDLIDEYGPGHNSFTVDEDGNTIFVYHSRSKECYEGSCGYGHEDPLYDPCRSARIRKVVWDENGLPILNQ